MDITINLWVNYWAVLVCGVASMIIGGLWYGPLFGKMWIQEMGWGNKSPEEMAVMKKKANIAYPQAFIGALVMALVLSIMLGMSRFHWPFGYTEAGSIGHGLQAAFGMWLGFVLP